MKRLTFFGFCIVFILQSIHAQWINTMSISPATPTTADNISLFYSADFPASSCDIIEYTADINGNIITVNSTHEQGILTVICSSVQTIPVGYLSEGNYTLILNLFIPGSSTSQTINFTVMGSVNIGVSKTSDHQVQVFPNPAGDVVQIIIPDEALNQNIRLSIFNITGKEVYKSEKIEDIHVHNFPEGIYFLKIYGDQLFLESKIHVFR